MNLNKKALYLIVPVLLLSYCIAALSVFVFMRETTKRFEQSSLDLATTELVANFNKYSTFAESYLLALTENNAFRQLIKSDNDIYQHVALGSSIEAMFRSFKQHSSEKLTFSVVQNTPTFKQLYYFELSNDPFAVMSPAQEKTFYALYKNKKANDWDYIQDEKRSLIIVSRVIDRTTFQAPIPSLIEKGVAAQIAIEPTNFLNLKREIEDKYNAKISLFQRDAHIKLPPPTNLLVSNSVLGPNLALQVRVPDAYLNAKMLPIVVILIAVAMLIFLASAYLLHRLVNINITGPIRALEHELNDVLNTNKENIALKHKHDGEIGRLEQAFHRIYGDLSKAYLNEKDLAGHDSLTSLHNLSAINEKLEEYVSDAADTGSNLAIIYIDLDNFKFVNDRYGHDAGDALLQDFSEKLDQSVAHLQEHNLSDTFLPFVGRIAGDEFCVLVSRFSDDATLENIATIILDMFEDGFSFQQNLLPVSASIGIALYSGECKTASQLFANADHAMYQAKNTGKNKVAFYSEELAIRLRRRLDIEHQLNTINFDEEFFLVYMPLVCAKNYTITGFEVLIRWTSKKLGRVTPDEFIPIAEANGAFVLIDAWVVENSIKSYAVLKQMLGRDFKLSINLSSAQLTVDSIGKVLLDLLAKYQIEPKHIQLEMTETLNVEYTKEASSLLDLLSDSGFNIAIDDFGTGYTALTQLIEYPSNMIKLDKIFINKAMQQNGISVLAPLIDLCHSQGLKVTAEGVETEDMLLKLKSAGCDYFQGFFFGVPTTLEQLSFELPELLTEKELFKKP